jgi:hypothetical protein
VENIVPNNEVLGAIHTVVAHPTDADTLYIGAVNGGIWRTTNATAGSPSWTPLTDALPSLSIGALEMDPSDPDVLLAGIGRFSSLARTPLTGRAGGPLTGLLYTTDAGATWTQITDALLTGESISGVAPRGAVLLASSNGFAPGDVGGLFRSPDTGATWNAISGSGTGLPAGGVSDLVGDPTNASRFYAAVLGIGLFRSDDTGANWVNVSQNDPSAGGLQATITTATNNNNEMAVANDGRVYIGVLLNGQPEYMGFSDDQGGTWTAMDLPTTVETTGTVGLNPRSRPGGQGIRHFSIRADPSTSTTLYVGGDTQRGMAGFVAPQTFTVPNSIGALDFSGRLFRGDTTVAPTGAAPSPQWDNLTHSSSAAIPGGGTATNSSPHADSREMVFDANGNLVEVDDAGVYRRTSPANNTGDWFSINGNMQVTEIHDIAYDTLADVLIAGTQDTGTPEQITPGSLVWRAVGLADGGDVQVDDTSVAGQSTRYSSNQNFGQFRRRTYDAANTFMVETLVTPNVTSGPALGTQFITPLELNVATPTRLTIGGSNGVYESMDQGSNIARVPGFTGGVNRNAMAYGHANNAELIVVGSGTQVFVRTTAGGNLTATATAFPGTNVLDVAVDPADANEIIAIDQNSVYQTPDGGTTWNDVTGDVLTQGATNFRTVLYMNDNPNDKIVLGTNAGVFVTAEGSFGTWFPMGTGVPNAPVRDLDLDVADDLLVAGTLGRGAFTFANATQVNLPPVAMCMDVTTPNDPGLCSADVSVDDGSFDPDGGPLTLTQIPPSPYPVGTTGVTLVATDDGGLSDSCGATVVVEDVEPPTILCNAPPTIIPPDAPISFTAMAIDNCAVVDVEILDYDCFAFNGAGMRVDKTGSCQVSISGDTLSITVIDSGGVGDNIVWTVRAEDDSGNQSTLQCGTVVVNPAL